MFRDDAEELAEQVADQPHRAHRTVRQSIAAKTAALQRLRYDHNGTVLPDQGTTEPPPAA